MNSVQWIQSVSHASTIKMIVKKLQIHIFTHYLIKSYTKELSPTFQVIFNESLQIQHVPSLWEETVVVPVSKSSRPEVLNDFRPVAWAVINVFEKTIRSVIMEETEQQLDPM